MSDQVVKPCLVMILKDEAGIIEKTLLAVRPHVSAYCIADTGSTDDTVDIIKQTMKDLPGEVFSIGWEGFGPARTAVLERATGLGHDYAFMVDADERLTVPEDFAWPFDGRPDALSFLYDHASVHFDQLRVFRLDLPWRYVGVLHEYPTFGKTLDQVTVRQVSNARLVPSFDSARARDPKRYERDALLLEGELARTGAEASAVDRARYTFYCGQSWRDAGDDAKAMRWYEKRGAMTNVWTEETFVALLEAGRAAKRRNLRQQAIAYWLRASEVFPPRAAEPLYELAYMMREEGMFRAGLLFAKPAAEVPHPQGTTLFLDRSVYEWRALQELAVSAQRSGENDASAAASRRMLQTRELPADVRLQAEKNLLWAMGQGEKAEALKAPMTVSKTEGA